MQFLNWFYNVTLLPVYTIMYNWEISSCVPRFNAVLSWMWVFVFWQSLKSEDGLSWLMWTVRPDAGYTWVCGDWPESEPVQKSIMSFTQIKLHHSSPLLTSIHKIIRKSNVQKMSHFATKHSSSLCGWWWGMIMMVIGCLEFSELWDWFCCDVIRGHVNLRSHMAISWEPSGPAQTCRDQIQILTQLQ